MTKPAVQLSELLSSNAVLEDQSASDKKELIKAISQNIAKISDLEQHIIFDVLWEREKLGTTGVGQGIAIPHGRIDGLNKVRGFFARLPAPIVFDSVDSRPVDLVFVLLAPISAGADHLHALASVSRTLRSQTLCDNLRNAKHADLHKLLTSAQPAQAA